jgi:hypothetical protein
LAEAAAIRAIAFGWSVLNPDHCAFVLGVTEVPPSTAAQKFSVKTLAVAFAFDANGKDK